MGRIFRLCNGTCQVLNGSEELLFVFQKVQECKLGDNVDSDEEDSEDKKPDTLKVERITRKAIHQCRHSENLILIYSFNLQQLLFV